MNTIERNDANPDLDVNRMNRIIRHKLRNLCAGIKMTIDRISDQTSQTFPQVGERCSIVTTELNKVEEFTDRMDLIFDPLPVFEQYSLHDLISVCQSNFVQNFPFSSLSLDGKVDEIRFIHGTWIMIALNELLNNAGESAGTNGSVDLIWRGNSDFEILLINSGESFPDQIPTEPPLPFFTTKSRHDGLA